VRLFTFSDTAFSAGQLKATIGQGYSGINDLSPNGTYSSSYYFGSSVALNFDGSMLAVGAPRDNGSTYAYQSGAVKLFTFGSDFSGGFQVGTIGNGYTTTLDIDNVNVPLLPYEFFGSSVALNSSGTLLAVGSTGSDLSGATSYTGNNYGAVRLFSFGTGFTSGAQVAAIGLGYSGGQNVTMALQANANFGRAVALNAAGNQLAVGAPYDSGLYNNRSQSGAVHLFTFTDSGFGGGTLAGTIGSGYTGGKNVESGAGNNDFFGWSVALNGDGTRLAVGAPRDNGADNSHTDAGAVHLFGFTDNLFSGGRVLGRVGNGYQTETSLNLNVQGSRSWGGDQAGYAVALSADATQLVIGAPYDDAGNLFPSSGGDYGSVHLVTFADGNFGGGALTGTIGKGYSGGKNIDIALDSSDNFGMAVALSGDGKHLAVGVPYDDGFNNAKGASGAVHLFTFGSTTFGGGQKIGTMGAGYAGVGDVNVTALDSSDQFGWSVALNTAGTRLAVGARYDNGFNNAKSYTGAVHLFSFGDASFGGGLKTGTIGSGYVGTGDVNVTLDGYDYFGWSVALSGDASQLAVGAPYDSGYSNASSSSGAVHLFNFSNGNFDSGQKVGTVGLNYAGTGDVNVPVRNSDRFGYSIALSSDATQLVVGTPYDSGSTNYFYSSGAIHTFTFEAGFSNGAKVGTVGNGYSGTNDLDLTGSNLSYGNFGWSVALNGDGTRMAVGVPYDDGASKK
jgi:hypothetical protein